MRNPAARKARKTKLQARVGVLSLLLLFSSFLLPSPSSAGGPSEQVRGTVERVLTVVRNPKLRTEAQKENLRIQLAQVIEPSFDFTEMAKRSLGPHWGGRTAEEQGEFAQIFAGLLGRSYVQNIQYYIGQTVLYTREVEDKNYAQVDTTIVTENRADVSINYRLHKVGKEWRVYDLVIEDISVVNNYRSQFNRVILQSSFENLVRIMQEKQSKNSERVAPLNSAARLQRPSISANLTRIFLTSVQD